MPFHAFAYRGRRVDVKGRTRELAGRAERQGGGAASLTSRRRAGGVSNDKCLRYKLQIHTDAERFGPMYGLTV